MNGYYVSKIFYLSNFPLCIVWGGCLLLNNILCLKLELKISIYKYVYSITKQDAI